VTSVRDGGFYGWPETYIGAHIEPRLPAPPGDSNRARAAAAIVPDVLLQAHSSPMGMVLYDGDVFPDTYRGDLFIAFHGSYNRSRRTGYKVVRVPMDDLGRPAAVNGAAGYEDFATGWNEDPASIEVWGRPAGVAQYVDGSLLVLDDAAGRIWRIGYRAPVR
jgi:glucose/arabinose dehydrogenase